MRKFLTVIIIALITLFLSHTAFAGGVVVPLHDGGGVDSEGNYYTPLEGGGMFNAKAGYATPIEPRTSYRALNSAGGRSAITTQASSVDKSTWSHRERNNPRISKVIGANTDEKAEEKPFKAPRGITFRKGKRIHASCGGY